MTLRRLLIEVLIAHGHSVTVLASPDDTVAKLEALGEWARPLAMSMKGMKPVRDARLPCRLRREFRALRPDVMPSFTIKPDLYGAQAARAVGIHACRA